MKSGQMKVLFLDIDGVLNRRDGGGGLEPDLVANLNELLAATGAYVVVSSSWRIGQNVETMTHILQQAGFRGEIIGLTPVHDWTTAKGRGLEIQQWMDECEHELDARDIAIVDDHDDMCHLLGRLVKTDEAIGLTRKKAQELARLLGARGL